MAVIIGIYKPNDNSKVDPDIPGKTIAEIASIPATITYKIIPILKLVTSIPLVTFIIDNKTTKIIPGIINNIFFLFLKLSFSSINIIGIEVITNPKNNELTLYIPVSKTLARIETDKIIPINQPIPSFTKNLRDVILSFFVPLIK